MSWKEKVYQPGVSTALGAALLFGAGTPFAKLLLNSVSPWLLAGLLYLGAGIGLTLYRRLRRSPTVRLPRSEVPWFAGAIVAGGIIGPVLLMLGLTGMPASGASLLLNAEGVFTALLAWFVFKENFDRRIALGMVAIVLGAIVLSWPGEARFAGLWPALAVLGACFAWGAVLAIAMGETVTLPLLSAGALMTFGVWLHLTERHGHEHAHELLEHEHEHIHDEHHDHAHDVSVTHDMKHSHRHLHKPLIHMHAHFPDVHHRRHSH